MGGMGWYTVVNVPTDNMPPALQPRQRSLNDALAERFAAGAFPAHWQLFDYAGLMARMDPPTIATYRHEHSWHFVCQLDSDAEVSTMSTHAPTTVMTRTPSGDCGEEGNTVLWEALHLRGKEDGPLKRSGTAERAPEVAGAAARR